MTLFRLIVPFVKNTTATTMRRMLAITEAILVAYRNESPICIVKRSVFTLSNNIDLSRF